MRNHLVTDSGRRRHSVYFSVIEEEWPHIRQHLESRLARLKRPIEPEPDPEPDHVTPAASSTEG
jgi:hypothetical protein